MIADTSDCSIEFAVLQMPKSLNRVKEQIEDQRALHDVLQKW
jgi:hypothetical protein